ncbi:MAG: Ig-like domain-containing protein [Verrucomicrobia bacterium]|nr:Ig-like domain-containing protein [Verrucomicrobiota bacterium]
MRQINANYPAYNSRVFHLSGSSALSLSGCSVTTEERDTAGDLTWRVGYGIVAEDASSCVITNSSAGATTIKGFVSAGVYRAGQGGLTMTRTQVSGCGVGIHYMGSGPLAFTAVTVSDCGTGFKEPSGDIAMAQRGIRFEGNGVDQSFNSGFTVASNLTIPAGIYWFDCKNGPAVVQAGATLTIAAGVRIVVFDSNGNDHLNLFKVYGTLVASGGEFVFETYSKDAANYTTSIELLGDGNASFTECLFSTTDRVAARDSRVISVAERADLTLDKCRFQSTTDRGASTYYGLVWNSTGDLALTDTLFMAFKEGIRLNAIPVALTATGNQFLGNTTYAVRNMAGSILDFSGNWWGHPSGPKHSTNPLGQGDPVSVNVTYGPWSAETTLETLTVTQHSAGQATNAFLRAGSAPDVVFYRFGLTTESTAMKVLSLALELFDVQTLAATNLTSLRLVHDLNGDGLYQAGTDTVVGLGQLDWAAKRIRFPEGIPVNGEFLVLADLVDVPSLSTCKVRLTPLEIKVPIGTFVSGSVLPAIHLLDRILLSDHRAGVYRDGLWADASQEGIPLFGFNLSQGALIDQVTLNLTGVSGIDASKFGSVRLIDDRNGNGIEDGADVQLATGQVFISGTTGTIVFGLGTTPFTSGSNYIVKADFSGLRSGDRVAVTLPVAGLRSPDVLIVINGSTSTVFHEVDEPLFVVDAGFQVGNALTESPHLSNKPLLGFMFIPGGRTVNGIAFDLTDVYGIRDFEFSNVRMVRDDNANGQLDPAENKTVGGTGVVEIDDETGIGTIRFPASFTVQGSYLLVADLANVEKDDSLTVALRSEQVQMGANDAVDGGVSPVRHAVTRPDLPNSSYQQNWTLTWRSAGGLTVTGGYSRDGKKMVLGYSSGAAYVYDLATQAPEKMLMRHYDKVQYASFSADDSRIITVTRDGAVYVWDATTGDLVRNFFADVLVDYAEPSPNFERLLVVTADRTRATMLDVLTGNRMWEFQVGAILNAVDFSPDGTRLIIGCSDKFAYLVDAVTGAIPTVNLNGETYQLRYTGHSAPVTSVAFVTNGSRIYTASSDATAVLWDVNNPVEPITTKGLSGQGCRYAWVNRDGTRVAMITGDSTVRMFNESLLELYAFTLPATGFTSNISFAGFSDDGSEFMVASNDQYERGALVCRYKTIDHTYLGTVGPTGKVSANYDSPVRMSEDGYRVFFMKNNGLEIVHRPAGIPIRHYTDLSAGNNYDITPDGSKIAWMSGSTLNYAVVDEERLTRVAANSIAASNPPLEISDSGGLAIAGDKLYYTVTGDLFADTPNVDGNYRGRFSPNEEFWGIAISRSLKTMRTTNAAGGLEFAVTQTDPYYPWRPIYHPDGIRVGCVFDSGVQFYRIDNGNPVGLYDYLGTGLQDAVLSHDGTMLLVSRGNRARLYDMETGRVLRYFYPMHSGQATCYVRAIGMGAKDDIIMIAWSDNYIETYERSKLVRLEINPATRTIPVGATQAFRVDAVYDDGSRQDVSPRNTRTAQPTLGRNARFYADPAGMLQFEENRVTVASGASGQVELKAVYTEGGIIRDVNALITVNASSLVKLEANPAEITLSHGVVLPITYTAEFSDGYREAVNATLSTADSGVVTLSGNNVIISRDAGTRQIVIEGRYAVGGITKVAQTRIFTHGPQSNWTKQQVTSGGDILAMRFSPDGLRLATAGSSGAVSIYRVGSSPTNYTLEKTFPAHERTIRHLFYTSASEMITVGEDGAVRTWDLSNTAQPRRVYSHDAVIECAFYKDGLLALGDNLGRVSLLSTVNNVMRWKRQFHNGRVLAVAFDSDSVLSGGDDATVVLANRVDGTVIQSYPGYSAPVIAVGYRSGRTFAVSEDKRMVEWVKGSIDDGLWETFLPDMPTAVLQTSTGLYITTGAELGAATDASAGLGSLLSGLSSGNQGGNYRSTTWVYDNNGLLLTQMTHSPQEGKVRVTAIDPSGMQLLTGRSTVTFEKMDMLGNPIIVVSDFHSAQFWDLGRGNYTGSLDHNNSIESAKITQDGHWLVTQSAQRIFRWGFDSTSMSRDKFLETGYTVPYRFDELRLSNDEDGTLVTRIGETLYLMNLQARTLSKSVHTGCSTFDISGDGNYMVTNGDYLRFWDISVDFPTVVHENPKDARAIKYMPKGTTNRIRDCLIGFDSVAELGDPYLAIFNRTDQPDPLISGGAEFSGITLPVAGYEGAKWTRVMDVSRNQNRCVVVAQVYQMGLYGPEPVDKALAYVIDLTNRLSPQLLRTIEIPAKDGKAAVAMSDDGTLLFYGGVSTGDDLMVQGTIYDINRGVVLYSISPPSAGSMSNLGPAAAQFTQNDGALMVAWTEGYAAIYQRQGLRSLDVMPSVQTVSAGQTLRLEAEAVYVDGGHYSVTNDSAWSLQTGAPATISGPVVTVDGAAALGSTITVACTFQGPEGPRMSTATLKVAAPTFVELVADPVRTTVAPGGKVTYRFFAKLANGSSVEVTSETEVTVAQAERATVAGNVVTILAAAQYGFLEVEAKCVRNGDERRVTPIIQIASPTENTNPGDFDGDLDVDFSDLLHMIGHYRETTSSATWDSRCDFDYNGKVEYADVTQFISLYGKKYVQAARAPEESDPVPRKANDGDVAEVQVWLEGPVGRVRVGDTIAINLYVKEDSLAAAGITGVPLDVIFPEGLARYGGAFNAASVIKAPFNSILTSGTLLDGRIDELGGITVAKGKGDGSPFLFATLTFQAVQAGSAVFSLSPGDTGIALAQPVGMVHSTAVDYGNALEFTIIGDNTAPIAQGTSILVPAGTATPITLQASDAESDPLSLVLPGPGQSGYPQHGTVETVVGAGAFFQVRYKPAPGFSGIDSFSFSANDGQLTSAPAQVTVNVGDFVQTLDFRVDGGSVGQVSYGIKPGANDAFAASDGESLVSADEVSVMFHLAGDTLDADVRGSLARQIWQLELRVPGVGDGESTCALAWDGVQWPQGYSALLIPTDAAGRPIDAQRASLDTAGEVRFTKRGAVAESRHYVLLLDQKVSSGFTIRAGGNPLGFDIEPDMASTDALLRNGNIVGILRWKPHWGYLAPQALDARTGYMIYSDADFEITLNGFKPLEVDGELLPGWNLVSPWRKPPDAGPPGGTGLDDPKQAYWQYGNGGVMSAP